MVRVTRLMPLPPGSSVTVPVIAGKLRRIAPPVGVLKFKMAGAVLSTRTVTVELFVLFPARSKAIALRL